MKVFMPSKPIRKGLKALLLTEAKSGFVLNWSLYTGKNPNNDQQFSVDQIVRRLCLNYEGEGFVSIWIAFIPVLRLSILFSLMEYMLVVLV